MPLCVSANLFFLISGPLGITARSHSVILFKSQFSHLNTPSFYPPTRVTGPFKGTPSLFRNSIRPLTLTPLFSPTLPHAMPFSHSTQNSGLPPTALSPLATGFFPACEFSSPAAIMPVILSNRAALPPLQKLELISLSFKLLDAGLRQPFGFTSVKTLSYYTPPFLGNLPINHSIRLLSSSLPLFFLRVLSITSLFFLSFLNFFFPPTLHFSYSLP